MVSWILCVLLAAVCVVLVVKNYLVRKSMEEICDCVRLHLSTDTNLAVRISSKDKYVCRLALEMENSFLKCESCNWNMKTAIRS